MFSSHPSKLLIQAGSMLRARCVQFSWSPSAYHYIFTAASTNLLRCNDHLHQAIQEYTSFPEAFPLSSKDVWLPIVHPCNQCNRAFLATKNRVCAILSSPPKKITFFAGSLPKNA